MLNTIKAFLFLLVMATLAYAQSFPPAPYGTSGGGGGSGGSTPGGSNGDVQFNNSNTFGGSDNLYWSTGTLRLGVNTKSPDNTVQITTSTTNTGLHVGPAFLGSAYNGSGCPGCQGDALISINDANPVGDEVYAIYMANNGPNIFNTPPGTSMQFRVGGGDQSYYFDNSGVGALGINTNGALVSNGVLNVSGGNGALEWDHNSTTEFFVKNSSGGSSAAALITVENNNAAGGQAEGWLYLPSGAYGTLGTHQQNTVELYAHQGAGIRLATQESQPIDFWTNATQRMFMDSSGDLAIGDNSPLAKFEVRSSTTPTSYVVAFSSQNASVMFGVQGNGSIALNGGVTTGSALCVAASNILGHCTSVVGAGGTCTCVAN